MRDWGWKGEGMSEAALATYVEVSSVRLAIVS